MTQREEFEKFCDGFNLARSKSDADKYVDRVTLRMWETWQAATKAAVPKWIPVSERLPEFKQGCYEYLVLTDGKVQHDYFNCPFSGGDYFEPFWNHYGERVTHWMPLPNPPKE